MSHYQTVTVTEVNSDTLTLQLPNTSLIVWPQSPHTRNFAVGDELVLTLTNSEQMLNDILQIDE